jgi:hypothetical protein
MRGLRGSVSGNTTSFTDIQTFADACEKLSALLIELETPLLAC